MAAIVHERRVGRQRGKLAFLKALRGGRVHTSVEGIEKIDSIDSLDSVRLPPQPLSLYLPFQRAVQRLVALRLNRRSASEHLERLLLASHALEYGGMVGKGAGIQRIQRLGQ